MAWLRALLGRAKRVVALDLGGCDLGRRVEELGASIASLSCLRDLNLAMNAYGEEGAVGVKTALHKRAAITALDLSFNCMMAAGLAALAPVLARQANISRLNLMGNAMEDQGCLALAGCLSAGSSLQHLNVANNLIGDEGVVALLQVRSGVRFGVQGSGFRVQGSGLWVVQDLGFKFLALWFGVSG